MRRIVLFGLAGGAVLAAGQIPAQQWHTISQALLALTLAHGLTVLPWLLAALFAWRYWRWKQIALLYDRIAADEIKHRQRLGAALWEKERVAERRPQRRKRA